ncbi:MAG: DUF1684 domain-containing protein [Luteibaculum sp.]
MKLLSLIFLLSFSFLSLQAQEYISSIRDFQTELNQKFKDPEKSPLTAKDLQNFKGLNFYPIQEKYRVVANFQRAKDAIPFQMKTTTSRMPTYELYGIASFELDGETYSLNIYQSHDLRKMEDYKDHLFLPFTDLSSGDGTYGGGRYIDLNIPEGDSIVIDFNKAYNPYCAYNYKYSCPIPPKENDLPIAIEAGVKY